MSRGDRKEVLSLVFHAGRGEIQRFIQRNTVTSHIHSFACSFVYSKTVGRKPRLDRRNDISNRFAILENSEGYRTSSVTIED